MTGVMFIPLKFAPLYDDQEVFVRISKRSIYTKQLEPANTQKQLSLPMTLQCIAEQFFLSAPIAVNKTCLCVDLLQ